MLVVFYLCLEKRRGKPESEKSESSSSKEEKDSKAEENSNSDEMCKPGKVWARSNQWLTSYMAAKR